MLKGVIFDFDGVIAKSIKVKTNAFASLYQQYGDNVIRKVIEHHEANGGMSRFEKFKLYHKIYLNKEITNKEIEELAHQFSKIVLKQVISCQYVPGVLKYIQKCYEKYNLFISTGTPTDEIKEILIGRGIAQYFTEIYGSPMQKNIHISNIMFKYEYSPNELLFYGDAKTDIDAAKLTNVPFVLIKNRHNKKLAEKFKGKSISNFIGLT